MRERSAGKDTTTGHWEICGLVVERPFPTYPDGFPPEVIEPFERAVGLPALGNVAASGTEIIEALGEEHVRTGRPIVYTSADSVFQIAAHKDVVPLDRLYEWCRLARGILDGEHRVGRVIARPFVGEPGSFTRTHERRDFSVEPFAPTYLDRVLEAGIPVFGVGKIPDIFAGRGLTDAEHSESNDHGIDLTVKYLGREDDVLVVTNLVDFDTKYGHRNDAEGYARCVEAFDRRVPELVAAVGEGLLFLTGDHGCDPTDVSTDHTREHTPVLVAGGALAGRPAVDLGVRDTFADLGATVASLFGVDSDGLAGSAFARELGVG
jgi:phosphopentomutase